MPSILVVDDDKRILDCFKYAFSTEQLRLETAQNAVEALTKCREQAFDAVVVDIGLPDTSGLILLRELRAWDARMPVILMTGVNSANSAIEAMQQGAFDYLLKPLDLDHLHKSVDRAIEASRLTRHSVRIVDKVRAPSTNSADGNDLIGHCPAMQEVYRQIGRVAGQDVTVLILGESGTGKEVVARAIYQYSRRSSKPFRAINCAAIPEDLLESELFGHEKGSFTGADRKRIGKFEQCDDGTLFLDEIGDMTPLTQTKVLRVIQDQQFERVGGNELVQTKVRLIAATSRNLMDMIADGTFRNDLYYRLNVYTIHLPPLRERHGDIPLLVAYFLERFCRELEKPVLEMSLDAMELLSAYQWPGNIRELQSVLKHAVVESPGPVILPESLPESVRGTTGSSVLGRTNHVDSDQRTNEDLIRFIQERIDGGVEDLYGDIMNRVERLLLIELLNRVHGNISTAASMLGLARSTVRVKLAALGIQVGRTVKASH